MSNWDNASECLICEQHFYSNSLILALFGRNHEPYPGNVCINCNSIGHHLNRQLDEALKEKDAGQLP